MCQFSSLASIHQISMNVVPAMEAVHRHAPTTRGRSSAAVGPGTDWQGMHGDVMVSNSM